MNSKECEPGDLTARRPPETMTNAEWQEYFSIMRSNTRQSIERSMNKHKAYMWSNGRSIADQTSYCGDTQYEKYCDFINDMLKTIRSGHDDYCYFIFQVADLLRFEHDHLRTEYMQNERCIRVWLS